MQLSRNIMPVLLTASCLALAVAGCGQKGGIPEPPPPAAPASPSAASPNTMSLDQQAAMHAHGPAGKPH